jgi:tetratricopeptide (TPR) repeat protein
MCTRRCLLVLIGSVLLFLGSIQDLAGGEDRASDSAIGLSQRLIQRNPLDARSYYRLGDAYIQKARETGDASYFTRAAEALRKSLAIAPGQSGALRHLAYVLYSLHDFEGAAAQAARAIELNPTDGHAHGILGDAYLEVGQYARAEEAYRRMLQTDGDLYSYSRLAGLKSLRGDVDGAIADLEGAIEAGTAKRRPAEAVAWTQWQLGAEHWSLGNLRAAEAAYLAALNTFPKYHQALAGLAHVRVAQQRYPEATELYEKAIAIIPQPDYAAALGDVFAKVGRSDDAKKQYALVEYIGRLSALNQILYNRELAYFYADHDVNLDRALELARRELEVRHDIYAYDVLAWALYKNGQPEAAREAMSEALRLGTRDARLFFHAGLIERRLDNREAAREYLERALATNPHFHVLQADLARRVLTELEGTSVPTATPEARHGR